MSSIEKNVIIITSLGRTGTDFFAKLYSAILPDAIAVHEPDIFQNTGIQNKWGDYLQRVRRAGVWHAVVLKALGKWTLVKISDEKLLGSLSPTQAALALLEQRRSFVKNMPGSIYVESNIGYYGLLDITPQVFENHKAVFIIRDGRDWVRSHMNWGEFYGKKGLRKLISHNWPPASALPLDPYAKIWDALSRFEKLCWAWARLNKYALETLAGNPHVRVFQFEQIFSEEGRYRTLNNLVEFTTKQPGVDPAKIGDVSGWLERPTHQSRDGFPAWEGWTREQQNFFKEVCGALMEETGYQI
jgi:hypothetical protein